MQSLSKSKSKRTSPVEIVQKTRKQLIRLCSNALHDTLLKNKIELKLSQLIRELKTILYGTNETEPVAEECEKLTQEFFKDNTFRLLLMCFLKLSLETQNDVAQVVANLQRQQVKSHLMASIYLEENLDLVDHLISGYEDPQFALHFGNMLRECLRHQNIARYVLESKHVRNLFDYMQLPSFDIAADSAETFKVLLTRHKSTVSEFLSKNYEWFFQDYNSKMLECNGYFTRRLAIQVLREILLHPSNSAVMIRYVSSKDNLRILMNLLRDSSKRIQTHAFHVFKLFVANENKPSDINNMLAANQVKLIRLFSAFKNNIDEDEQFEDDKAQLVKQISQLNLLIEDK